MTHDHEKPNDRIVNEQKMERILKEIFLAIFAVFPRL
jgi:hypothetical protein